MKSIYSQKWLFYIIPFLLFSYFNQAQHAEFNYGNRWRLGLNVGNIKLFSDLSDNKPGSAGGFTIEKGFTNDSKSVLGFDLRYRFLGGSATGLDTRVNTYVQNNEALNGINNTAANYTSVGYFFNNYRTTIIANDLELKVGFNRLLERKRIHLYFWGGAGLTYFNTKVDALHSGSVYDFSSLDTTGGSVPSSQLSLFDGKYETDANGNSGVGKLKFGPTFGFGIGYKFTRHFSLIFESKLNFPGSDLMDGENSFQKANPWSATNDYLRYSTLKFLFTLGRGSSSASNTNSNPNNYTNVNTAPPDVIIVSPSQNPYTSPVNNVQIYATVKNVSTAAGISVQINGIPFSNFNYTPSSGALSFSTFLQSGANTIVIRGTNNYGSDVETLVVNWNQVSDVRPPVVTIYNPVNNSTVQSTQINVTGNVKNVSFQNQVSVNVNGTIINNFSFNPSNGDVAFAANLLQGNNTITISGTNQYGNDSKSVFVYVNAGFTALQKPVITILNPPNPGYEIGRAHV